VSRSLTVSVYCLDNEFELVGK